MNLERFQVITRKYSRLRLALVGDFSLDRYLEIDPDNMEISIETGLPVHNVVNVRSQPGAAGTILNNLVALGIGDVYPVGFCGMDGEGFELQRALRGKGSCIHLEGFFASETRRTFTYCKPLVLKQDKAPVELNRLDTKNWSVTPVELESKLIQAVRALQTSVDAMIVLDQVDVAGTGVITSKMLQTLGAIAQERPELLIVADSRRSLQGYPHVCFKMNAAELSALTGEKIGTDLKEIQHFVSELARKQGRHVFVTLSERGMVGAAPDGEIGYVDANPVRGEIDIVGAGDAVTANLTAALAAGASLMEALELANAAASVVIHQLGTTGAATGKQIGEVLAMR